MTGSSYGPRGFGCSEGTGKEASNMEDVLLQLVPPSLVEAALSFPPLLLFGLESLEDHRDGHLGVLHQTLHNLMTLVPVEAVNGLALLHTGVPSQRLIQSETGELLSRHPGRGGGCNSTWFHHGIVYYTIVRVMVSDEHCVCKFA